MNRNLVVVFLGVLAGGAGWGGGGRKVTECFQVSYFTLGLFPSPQEDTAANII